MGLLPRDSCVSRTGNAEGAWEIFAFYGRLTIFNPQRVVINAKLQEKYYRILLINYILQRK